MPRLLGLELLCSLRIVSGDSHTGQEQCAQRGLAWCYRADRS